MLFFTGLPAFLPMLAIGQVAPTPDRVADPRAAVACDGVTVAACAQNCDAGAHQACSDLAGLYAMGRGVPKDVPRAALLYERACEAGLTSACFSAAALYESGDEIPKDLKRTAKAYQRGCASGDRFACEELRRLTDPAREEPASPPPVARTDSASPPVATARDRTSAAEASVAGDAARILVAGEQRQIEFEERLEKNCANGHWGSCFALERTLLSGGFVGFELVHLTSKPEVEQESGFRPGWGGGLKGGVDFWNLLASNVGFRIVSVSDTRPFSEVVYTCDRQGRCFPEPHREESSVQPSAFLYLEGGLQRTFRLYGDFAVAPAVLFGYAAAVGKFERGIGRCEDCRADTLDPSGSYVAPSLRLVLQVLGISARYERYLSGNLDHGLVFALDAGLWPAAVERGKRRASRERVSSTAPSD
jgi:hypothetical protein